MTKHEGSIAKTPTRLSKIDCVRKTIRTARPMMKPAMLQRTRRRALKKTLAWRTLLANRASCLENDSSKSESIFCSFSESGMAPPFTPPLGIVAAAVSQVNAQRQELVPDHRFCE